MSKVEPEELIADLLAELPSDTFRDYPAGRWQLGVACHAALPSLTARPRKDVAGVASEIAGQFRMLLWRSYLSDGRAFAGMFQTQPLAGILMAALERLAPKHFPETIKKEAA